MTPTAFQGARILRTLNVVAVGFGLGAIVGVLLPMVLHVSGFYVGLSTLVVGLVWARVLRIRATIARTSMRWGWLASVPLAAANAALACGLLMVSEGGSSWVGAAEASLRNFGIGALLGATVGAIVWIPALFLTLFCFGMPIAWSQLQAKKGLAGEELGERIIGGVSSSLSLLALVLTFSVKNTGSVDPEAFAAGIWFVRVMAIVGALSGGVAAGLAHAREARRRAFVTRAEAGDVPWTWSVTPELASACEI